jgi:hypothetical protein
MDVANRRVHPPNIFSDVHPTLAIVVCTSTLEDSVPTPNPLHAPPGSIAAPCGKTANDSPAASSVPQERLLRVFLDLKHLTALVTKIYGLHDAMHP